MVFDLVIPQPGKYTFVDHDIRNVLLGSVGVLESWRCNDAGSGGGQARQQGHPHWRDS